MIFEYPYDNLSSDITFLVHFVLYCIGYNFVLYI